MAKMKAQVKLSSVCSKVGWTLLFALNHSVALHKCVVIECEI